MKILVSLFFVLIIAVVVSALTTKEKVRHHRFHSSSMRDVVIESSEGHRLFKSTGYISKQEVDGARKLHLKIRDSEGLRSAYKAHGNIHCVIKIGVSYVFQQNLQDLLESNILILDLKDENEVQIFSDKEDLTKAVRESFDEMIAEQDERKNDQMPTPVVMPVRR